MNYGDGTGTKILPLSASKTFALSHLYAASGTFSVTVQVRDNGGLTGSDTVQVVVVLPRYEQTDSRLQFFGSWTNSVGTRYSAGSYRYGGAGAAAYIAFTGTRIDWVARTGPTSGKAWLTLDGGARELVDLYSRTIKYRQTVWSRQSLSAGAHWLLIQYSGQKNPASTGFTVNLDALDILGSPAAATTRYSTSGRPILRR